MIFKIGTKSSKNNGALMRFASIVRWSTNGLYQQCLGHRNSLNTRCIEQYSLQCDELVD